ncbi:MAG TPA: SDR family oxidoreductase [Polyangiaceae bacterium]
MILVTGATGKIGSHALKLLSEAGVPARAFVRDPSRLFGGPPGVEIVKGDLDDAASLRAALTGVDAVLLITAPNAKQELDVVAEAKDLGVKKIVKVSSMGADPNSKLTLARGHFDVEAALKASGLKWTILRPGMFAQNFLQFAESIRQQGKFFASVKQGRIAMIDVRDIAEVAVKALLDAAHDGKTYLLTGPSALSYDEAAAILSGALDKTVVYVDVPIEKSKKSMLERGMPSWLVGELALLQENIAKTMEPVITNDVRRVLGRHARKFEDFARDYAAAFR